MLALLPCKGMAQRDSILLEGVEVRGVSPTDRIKASVPTQNIDRGDMVKLGIFGIEDVLKHLVGITVKDYGGAGGMKTVSVRGIGAKHTTVVYDGVALTDMQTGEADLSRYSMANMQSVRLTIGDGDNIFVPARNTASAATLELVSDLGTASAEPYTLRAGVAAGSWGTVEPSIYWRRRVGQRFVIGVQGNYLHTDGNYPFTLTNGKLVTRERRTNSRMNSWNGEINVAWQPSEGQRLAFKGYYYDNNHELPGIVRLYTQDNDEHLRDRNAFGQLSYQATLSSNVALKASGKINWVSTRYRVGIPSGGVKSEDYWQREYYATTSVLYTPWRWLAMDYSADYALNNLNSTLTTPTASTMGAFAARPYRHTVLQTIAAKASYGRVTGVARLLRSDYFNGVDEGEAAADAHHWSPSVSVSWQVVPRRQFFVRAFWKNIFRVPTFNELYYYHIGSTELRPENTSQWNIGVTGDYALGPVAFDFTIDAYVARVTDKIVAIPYNMFVWRMMNVSKVVTHGVDATTNIDWRIGRVNTLDLDLNYSLQRAQNRTRRESPYYGNQIAYVPEHTFSATVSWLNPWVNCSATIDGQSTRWTTNEHATGTNIEGFAEVGVSVFRTLTLRHCNITLRGAIHNIFDKQYDIVAHYPMPGRSWRLSAVVELPGK